MYILETMQNSFLQNMALLQGTILRLEPQREMRQISSMPCLTMAMRFLLVRYQSLSVDLAWMCTMDFITRRILDFNR